MIKKKFKKVNNVNLFSQHSLIIFTKDADIFGHDCTFILSFTMKADAVTEMSRLFPEVQNRYCVIFNALSLLTLYLQNRKLT